MDTVDTRQLSSAFPRAEHAAESSGSPERGASAVEYGLLISGIAALIAAAVFAFGGNVTGLFSDTCEEVVANQGSGSCG